MKYKMMADESFTDKLDETIKYQPGDIIKTKVDEERKENLVVRKLAHVVEEIDTTDDENKPKNKGKGKGKKEEVVEPPVDPSTDDELTEPTESTNDEGMTPPEETPTTEK